MPCQPEGTVVLRRPLSGLFVSVALRVISHAPDLKPSDNVISFVRRTADVLLSEHGHVPHAMKNITVRLDEELIDELELEADEHGVSRSEYIRNTLVTRDEHDDTRDEYEQEITDLKERINELETENERMRNEKRLILEQREENTELVEYVQEERELQQRREERLDAPVWRRAKWWLVGR